MSIPLTQPEDFLVSALREMRGQRGAIASLALGYGVERFEQSIPTISASTGISMDELLDAVTFCRVVLDPSQPRVVNQHLVTRSILKNFSFRTNSGYLLREFENATGLKPRPTSIRRAGTVQNFIKLDSQSSENHWGRFETRFPEAVASIENSTLSSRPDLVEVIKNLLALHFARSHELQVGVRAIRAPGMRNFMNRVGLDDAWLMQAHLDRFGFVVTDIALTRERLEEAMAEEFDSHTESGVYFRLRIPDFLQRAREILAQSEIEVWRPESADDEFLIGDNPLITPDATRTKLGILDGLAIGNAATVIMPLSPRITVSLGNRHRDEAVDGSAVRELNELQLRKARRSVYFRPGSPLEASMAVHATIDNSGRWSVPEVLAE